MKLTQEIIDQIQDAMNHTKRNGDTNWQDGDEIDVCLAGTFAADTTGSFVLFLMTINLSAANVPAN